MARRPVLDIPLEASSDELVNQLVDFYDDPLGFVYFAFPWGEEDSDLHDEVGPDEWQVEFLTKLGEAVKLRAIPNAELGAYLAGCVSGHGVGKTALLAWLILWFLSTRVDPQLIVTANTQGQLRGKVWRELALWHRRCINSSWFQWTATRLYSKARPATHFADAVPWSKENTEAIQGAHAKDVLIIFDESSGIDDGVWSATEGALTTSKAIWLAFGNMTRNHGRFRECVRQFRHRWDMMTIDSRTARKANQNQIQKWIDDYGEDSDFVRMRVRGLPPRADSTQLIGTDLVEQAQLAYKRRFGDQIKKGILNDGPEYFTRHMLDDNPLAPVIMALDVARFGGDQSVLGFRQGRTFLCLEKWRELDAVQLAARVAVWLNIIRPDMFLVDGGGIGGPTIDIFRAMGFEVEEVIGGNPALDPRKFFNRRAEMWWNGKEWLKAGGRIDHLDTELAEDLVSPEYGYGGRMQLVQLETKDDMRARGMASPDSGDAMMMTLYMPVAFRNAATSVASQIAAAAREYQSSGERSWMSY